MQEQLTSKVLTQQPRPIFKNRPGLAVFLAVILGITTAEQFAIQWSIAWPALLVSFVILIGVKFVRIRELQNIAALIVCASLGLAIYSFAAHQHANSPLTRYAENGGRSKVTGIVECIEQTRNGHLMIVEVRSIERDSVLLPINGKLAVQLGEAREDAEILLPEERDTITLYADIFPLRGERNPYAGSYDDRLKYHYGANATAQLNSRFDYYVSRVWRVGLWDRTRRSLASIKESCDRILSSSIADTTASAFVRAVVLGTRGDLPAATVLDFKHSGLTHLLAISGFNIAVVSLLIAQGLLLMGVRRRSIRLPVTAAGVAFYCFVVGLEPSVIRALVMIELYITALLLERKSDLTNIAALTALVHIFLDPMVVHDAGFQLSYAAVFGFALIQPHLSRLVEPAEEDRLDRERNVVEWLRHSLVLSLSAFLATTPVLLYHFRQMSFVVLIANLLAIPLAALITTLGFILIPLGAFLPDLASVYGDAISWAVHLLLASSAWLASITQGGFVLDLSGWVILLLSAGVLWIVQARTGAKAVLRLAALVCVMLFTGIFIDLTTRSILPSGQMSIVFADVGQGDAAILKTPAGTCYMFDFGPLSGTDPNLPARPYGSLLQVEGIDHIKAGFITHLHRDHYGAAISAVHSDAINTIYTVGDRTSDEFAFGLDSLVRAKEVKVEKLHSGQILSLDDGMKIYVLGPDSSERADEINNDRSLALRVVYGRTSVLMLGDIEQQAERKLVERYGTWLKSDVVKVAHHGSISSSTNELVRAASPGYAIISCGRNNQFGHPHPRVVSRWLRSGAKVLRTDLDAALILTSNGNRIERVDWRD